MPVPEFSRLGDNPTLQDLTDYIHKLQKELNYLLSSLDTLNISRIDAKVIKTGILDAGKVIIQTAGSGRRIELYQSELKSLNDDTQEGFTLDGSTGDLIWYSGGVVAGGIYKDTSQGYEMLQISHSDLILAAGNIISLSTPLVYLGDTTTKIYVLGSLNLMDTGTITSTTPSGETGDIIWGTSTQGTGPHIHKFGQWYALQSIAV